MRQVKGNITHPKYSQDFRRAGSNPGNNHELISKYQVQSLGHAGNQDLPYWDRYGNDDPHPLNTEIFCFNNNRLYRIRRITLTNTPPWWYHHVIPYDKPLPPGTAFIKSSGPVASTDTFNCFNGTNDINCPVSEYIWEPWFSTSTSPQYHKGLVFVLSRKKRVSARWKSAWYTTLWKCYPIEIKKMNYTWIERHNSNQSKWYVMIMEFEIPRAGIKSYTCRRHTSIHSPIYALIPS